MVRDGAVLAFVLGVLGCGTSQTSRTNALPSAKDTAETVSEDTAPPVDTDVPDDPDDPVPEGHEIRLGEGIGPAQIGDDYWEFVDTHGAPDAMVAYKRVFFATWVGLGLELVVTSVDDAAPSADAEVVAVGTKAFDGFYGPVTPGMSQDEVIAALGESPEPVDTKHFYPAGGCVIYGGDASVIQVTVFPAYSTRSEPPEMRTAEVTP